MAVLIKSITSDPRYLDLCRRFRYDFRSASIVLFGFKPTSQQLELLEHAEKQTCRVTVSSGHGTGKSSQIAIVALLFLILYPESRIPLVANKLDQIKIGIWKNVRVYFRVLQIRFPWITDYFEITEESMYEKSAKGSWCIGMKSCQAGREEALAGEHAKYLLWLVDEASGLSDKAFETIDGSLTGEDNRVILLSQPTRDSGYFWKTHNDPKFKYWTRLTFNSEESSIVKPSFLLEKFMQYGYSRNSVEYMIRVRGLFPTSLKGYLLTAAEIQRAANKARPRLDADWGWVLSADVGNGRDSSVINIARVSGLGVDRRVVKYKIREYESNIDPVNFGREIINVVKSGLYPNISVIIDAVGAGDSTAQIVEEAGIVVERLNWGLPCFSDNDKDRFYNLRAQANVMLRDAIRFGKVKPDKSDKTRLQGSKIPYHHDERGRYLMERKDVMRAKLNLPSPDRWDTYAFLMIAEYTPANSIVDETVQEEFGMAQTFFYTEN